MGDPRGDPRAGGGLPPGGGSGAAPSSPLYPRQESYADPYSPLTPGGWTSGGGPEGAILERVQEQLWQRKRGHDSPQLAGSSWGSGDHATTPGNDESRPILPAPSLPPWRAEPATPAEHGAAEVPASVRVVVSAQFIFYVASGTLKPLLYLRCREMPRWGPAPAAFAAAFTTAGVLEMVGPLLSVVAAERWGQKVVYVSGTCAGAAAAIAMAAAPPAPEGLWVFCAGWGVLNAVPAMVRGVRSAFLARTLHSRDLQTWSQHATSVGLIGGLLGPVVALLSELALTGSEWVSPFVASAVVSAGTHAGTCAGLAATMRNDAAAVGLSPRAAGHAGGGREKDPAAAGHAGYVRRALFLFSAAAAFFNFSLSAGPVCGLQPLAVERFGWRTSRIALVYLLSSVASTVISLTSGLLTKRITPMSQATFAGFLFVLSATLFTFPPIAEWRVIAAPIIGLKATVLFMSAWSTSFAHLVGKQSITVRLSTVLTISPQVGGALGMAASPWLLPHAGTWVYAASALPAAAALLICLYVGALRGQLRDAAAAT